MLYTPPREIKACTVPTGGKTSSTGARKDIRWLPGDYHLATRCFCGSAAYTRLEDFQLYAAGLKIAELTPAGGRVSKSKRRQQELECASCPALFWTAVRSQPQPVVAPLPKPEREQNWGIPATVVCRCLAFEF